MQWGIILPYFMANASRKNVVPMLTVQLESIALPPPALQVHIIRFDRKPLLHTHVRYFSRLLISRFSYIFHDSICFKRHFEEYIPIISLMNSILGSSFFFTCCADCKDLFLLELFFIRFIYFNR